MSNPSRKSLYREARRLTRRRNSPARFVREHGQGWRTLTELDARGKPIWSMFQSSAEGWLSHGFVN